MPCQLLRKESNNPKKFNQLKQARAGAGARHVSSSPARTHSETLRILRPSSAAAAGIEERLRRRSARPCPSSLAPPRLHRFVIHPSVSLSPRAIRDSRARCSFVLIDSGIQQQQLRKPGLVDRARLNPPSQCPFFGTQMRGIGRSCTGYRRNGVRAFFFNPTEERIIKEALKVLLFRTGKVTSFSWSFFTG